MTSPVTSIGSVFICVTFTFILSVCKDCSQHRDATGRRTLNCMCRFDIYVLSPLARQCDEPHFASLNIIVTIVQCFYLYRIWILAEKAYKVLMIPVLLTVIRIALGYLTAAFMFSMHVWPQYRDYNNARIVLCIALASVAANDVVITATQVYLLHRRRTGIRGTEYVIRTVMFYSVNTGALTTIFSIITLLSFVLDQSPLLYGGFIQVQCKLFENSLLVNINARRTLRDNQPSAVEIYPWDLNNT
ncbi:uncharacterized protein C8Q71DRAFT_319310 [Rhodofomes roseus]|uniref:DUF6534 domain-containing protein n=1 Tax=Rhodofomes roseus TaxID=34475 RepID=A0ABQ8K2I5_9APHY|nr:uncharacterized protein C8Q71DRAFT_319310 [Rhodofomes roseus]KAH9830714.1 hypothetical protein C8Q71DRAFT_319310 [Rhodofomes roseus]